MKKLKKIYIFFGLFLLIFVSIYSFSIQVFAATNEKTTDGKWTNSHTTENLVALTSDTLTEQGWYRPIPDQVKDQVGKTAGDDHLTSFTDPYGIQARGSSDDIGDKDYSNGVWVRVKLSAADIEKANKGDLTIDASARYYEQLTATHYCSVQIFFEKGSNYAAISNIGTKKKLSKNGEVLTISGKIPAGTTSFRYYVSNWGSLAGKPFIGDLRCSISDRTAAKMTSVTFDNSSITDQENNVAVSGDSLIYDLNFDEKIKSIETTSFYTGIASLMFEGETEPELTASPTLVHENGKSKVRYIFNLQDFYKTGKLYLSSINHLKVLDEGSNTTLVNGDVTSPKIQYYKDMSVKIDVNNLTYRYYNVAKYNKDLTATLISKKGYELPSTITVYAGTTRLKTTQYSYNKVTGDITVYGKAITGDIKIKASGVPKKYNVTFDKKGGINGSDSVITTYSESMPTITVPTKKGYTFLGYYYGENGQGRKYYNADGTSATTFYCYTDITLYAAWEANTYTIIYDKNTPANASNQVMGTMDDSIHTYDISKALSCNLYSLVGYTFKGWATSNNGSVIYSDEESVINLRESGSITLYAVWEANKYEIKYNANKPLGSSGNIFGSMNNSNHTYDVTKNLLDNEYSLVGYTFKGWSKSLNGIVDFKDGEDISNLSSENSDIVNLYAVWEANTYKISYNSNQPLGSSGTITGTMDDSIYKYDEENALDVNGFSLIGYTFKGWAIVKDGVIVYTDKQNVKNLASENNDVVNLYAVWEANKYSIVFNTMGGSFVNKIIITYDEDFSDIVIPSRKGYNFQGYYSLPEGEGTKYYNANGTAIFAKYNDDCDITLYAKWTPIVYNIELYNEGKCVEIIKDVVYGHMRLPSCQDLGIKKANYDFVGWNIYEDQNWSMYNANFDYDSGLGEYEGQSVVLYAAWLEKNIYSINYNANGGIGAPGMMQAHVDETITLTTLIPTRINYKFLGWSTNLNSIVVEYLPGSSFTMGDSPVTLYAIWELNPSLSYNANGGRFLYQAETLYPQEGSSVTITSMIPVLAGYVFIGWNENKDASVATYNSGDTFIMPSTNTVLYAIWKKAEYTITQTVATGYSVSELLLNYQYNDVVTFSVSGTNPKVYVNGELITPINGIYSFIITKNSNLIITDGSKISLIYSGNGGINEPVDRNSYDINSNAVISANYPSRIGYHFLGWSTNKESSTPEYYAENIINFESEDIILYAVWEANNYQITYNANGGTGTMLSDLLSYDTTFRLSINTYIKNGYTFLGWSLNPNGEKMYNDGDDVINLSYIQDDEIILYAIWKKTVTEINFVTINGIDTNLPFLIDYGSNLNTDNLTKPSRIGYIFLGYYTETNGAGDLIIDANLKSTLTNGWSLDIESITLYSHWKPITYSIIYMNGQTECNEQIVSYDTNFNLISFKSMEINVPNGYHFAGWSTIPLSKIVAYNDNQNITQALETNDGSKVYLYAVFEINQKYSIIYNANGGINAPIDNNLYYVGDMIIIPNTIPTLEGYKFLGWSYNYKNNPIDFPYVNDKFAIFTLSMVEEGITLYAVWKEDKTLQSQIDQVNALIKQLQSSIEGINNINEGFEKDINQLLIEMKQAQDVLNSLDGKYATYEELNKVITKLKNELLTVNVALQDAINAVQSNLDTAITNLNKTIATNKDDIESKLNEVIKAYELADSIINGKIQNLEAKDVELKNLIDSLTKSSKAADTALQDAINTVQSNLDTAITNLNKTIATNKDDIESKLNEVIKAYELADSIINGKIQNLETKDVELKNLIDSLTKSSKDADTALQDAINMVQTNLDNAIASLTNTIANNKDDIESKLNEVIKAYELADSIINGKIQNLETKDNELKNLIDSLTKSSKAADTALQDAINMVQTNLDNAIASLTNTIANNKDDIESKLNDVIKAYELADSIINGKIQSLESKDVELKNLIDSLTKSSKDADTALQDAINTVQSNLDTAITNLNKTIATNKDYIESKLNEVIKAYELADSIINGKIKNLETKDSELQNLIDSLTKSSKAADTALQDAINLVQTNLDNAIASLTDTIANNKDDIESKLNEIIKAYELADSIINGKIQNLEAKDVELKNLVDSLTKSSKAADTALQDAINAVQSNLDTAISSLTDTIANNKDDIESKLNEVIKAYELADSIINGKIQSLETKDSELQNLIDSLTKSSKAADTALQDAINTVQTNLNNAVNDLNLSIANNKQEIKEELITVKKAYEDADIVINSKISSLVEKNEELTNLFNSLQDDLKIAEEKIWKEINKLQDDLDKLKDEMNQKDNELEEMIRSLTETTEKDKNHLYTLNCICLGLIGFVAVVVIFFGLPYFLRTVKKKKLK